MTRLLQWLRIGGALAMVYYMALNDKFGKLDETSRFHVLVSPIYALIVFGIVSVFILINQVLKIKNCYQAYNELKDEINEARTELTKKGFKFN